MPSFKVEILADDSGRYVGNSLRFETERQAREYAADLAMRWTAVRDWRTVESEDEPNSRFVNNRNERMDTRASKIPH